MKLLNRFVMMMVLACTSVSLFAQDKKATILTIDNEQVSLEEFDNIFRKNNRDSIITQQALDEYMELFINFKLKVKEARSLGLDTAAKFKNELEGYRAQLARPYLTDADVLNDLMKEGYSRLKQEVHAYHILIKCEANASPEDTLKAFNRALDIRNQITGGSDFSIVAKDRSEDPSAKDNGGDLGYFTAFQMVYPFEEAAYNAKINEVTMPVRTRYGYHLIKVVDKREARGEIHVAHIMVKEKKEENGAGNAEAKANEIYQKALAGESFEDLAAKFSEDGSSAKKGGELPWFGTNKMVIEFEDGAFALKKDGDISRPIKTSYGWHIIKRLGYKPIGTYEELEKEIKSKVSKDSRSEKTKASFLAKLKKQYNFTYDEALINALAAKADTNIFNSKWNVSKKDLKKVMFTIDGKDYKFAEFHKSMTSRMRVKTKFTPAEYVKDEANAFATAALMKYEDSKLEGKYDAFRLLMNEYREGILLFELTDQKVWTKAVKDTVGLNSFYEANKSRFMWPDRAEAVIYTCANADIANKVRAMLAQGKSNAEITTEINKDTQLNLQIEEGLFSKEDNEVLGIMEWKNGVSNNIPYNNQVVVVLMKNIIPTAPKKLSEAKGLVTSEYQTYLEEQWIKELRAKYKFTINKDVLHSIH
ncbi:MAG: peptidylprolyl isomerase [Flavobacteriales bacterium]